MAAKSLCQNRLINLAATNFPSDRPRHTLLFRLRPFASKRVVAALHVVFGYGAATVARWSGTFRPVFQWFLSRVEAASWWLLSAAHTSGRTKPKGSSFPLLAESANWKAIGSAHHEWKTRSCWAIRCRLFQMQSRRAAPAKR